MKHLFLFFAFNSITISSFSQNYYEILSGWAKTDEFTGGTTVDNGYVLCGLSNSHTLNINNSDILLQKYNNAGALIWSKTFGTMNYDRASVVIQTSDKGFMVGGNSYGNCYIAKTDSAGNPQWAKSIAYAYYDSVCDLKQTPDKGYILTGVCSQNSSASFLFLIKIDSAGNIKWKKQYHASNIGIGRSVIITSDGNYLAVGKVGGQNNCYVLNVDTAGNTLWEYAYGNTADQQAYSVTEVAGNYYVLTQAQCVSYGFALLKITPSGELSWAKCIEHSNVNLAAFPQRILSSSDGNLLLTGMGAIQYLTASRNQMLIVKTDLSGNVLWTNSYGDSKRMEASSIVLEIPDGTLLLAGRSYDFDTNQSPQLYQVRTDFNGYISCTTYPYSDTLIYLSYTRSTVNNQQTANSMNITTIPANLYASSVPVIDFQCGTSVTTEEIRANPAYSIYPNPNCGMFHIQADDTLFSEKEIEIYSMLGEKIYSSIGNNSKETIRLNVPNGIYCIHIKVKEKNIIKNIIINK